MYGGWGRFGSRFLDALAPAAARETGAAVSAVLAPGARVAQVRPVNGFNANLHPLFVPDEIGVDRSLASLGVEDVELVHDPVGDDVRVRVRGTRAWVDVLVRGGARAAAPGAQTRAAGDGPPARHHGLRTAGAPARLRRTGWTARAGRPGCATATSCCAAAGGNWRAARWRR
nr:hypothetical protein [Streptomyces sp. Termitarium-T10T-6]